MSPRPALVLLVAVLATQTSALPADSRVTVVTVYADAAVVTRTAKLDLAAAGKAEVTFENLPADLVVRSLKATGHGTAQVQVLTASALPNSTTLAHQIATVRLEVTAPGQLDLALTYAVPGTNWSPTYEARILPAERAMQFGFFALIRQKTGENWENVELTLSTLNADGSRSQTYAAPTNPAPINAPRSGPAPKPQPNFNPPAPAATFNIPAPSTVAGDDVPTKVAVASGRLASENSFRLSGSGPGMSFPSLAVTTTNSFAFPLLAGPVKVFLGELSELRSIRTAMPGESFGLSQFSDKSFSARRRVDRVEDGGPLDKSWRITYDVTLTVQNHLPIAEKIGLSYDVPMPGISGSKKQIVVKVLPPTALEASIHESGGFLWNLTLQPGEVRDVPLRFSIEFLDMPIRQGQVKIGELKIVDDRTPAPAPDATK